MFARAVTAGLAVGFVSLSLFAPLSTAASLFPPEPPTGVTAEQAPEGVQLEWNPASAGEDPDGFWIYRSSGGPFTRIDDTTDARFLDPTGSMGTLSEEGSGVGMLYYVTAVDGSDESNPSDSTESYPYCLDIIVIPGPFGLPIGPAIDCYIPVPLITACDELLSWLDDHGVVPVDVKRDIC